MTKHQRIRERALGRLGRRHDDMVDAAITISRIHRAGPHYDEAEKQIDRATTLYREALDLLARLDAREAL